MKYNTVYACNMCNKMIWYANCELTVEDDIKLENRLIGHAKGLPKGWHLCYECYFHLLEITGGLTK